MCDPGRNGRRPGLASSHPTAEGFPVSDRTERDERNERLLAIVQAEPTVTQLADGSYRVEKAGMVGVGPTKLDAITDLSGKLWVAASRPPLDGPAEATP